MHSTEEALSHLVGCHMNYHATAKRFTASLPRNLALAILEEIDETEDDVAWSSSRSW